MLQQQVRLVASPPPSVPTPLPLGQRPAAPFRDFNTTRSNPTKRDLPWVCPAQSPMQRISCDDNNYRSHSNPLAPQRFVPQHYQWLHQWPGVTLYVHLNTAPTAHHTAPEGTEVKRGPWWSRAGARLTHARSRHGPDHRIPL